MDENRKYFGMTRMQVGILAGLAATAILLFCVIGMLMFGNLTGFSFSRAPADTPTPPSTPTLLLSPTPTPTETPVPIPYEELIPGGWVRHDTALVELWMPPGYASAGHDVLIVGLGNSAILEMSLRGSYSSLSSYRIYALVSYEPMTFDSLDDFLDDRLSALGPTLSLTERRKVDVNTTPAVRLMFEGRKGALSLNELTYVFLDGSTVWYVQYGAQINEFYEMLPTFEASVKTFRIVK